MIVIFIVVTVVANTDFLANAFSVIEINISCIAFLSIISKV